MAPRSLLAGLAATLLVGCALLRPAEPARVALDDLRPLASSADPARYLLRVRIQNPARAPLRVEGIACRLELEGGGVGEGSGTQAVSVPGHGEAVLEVELASDATRVLEPARAMRPRRGAGLAYRLTGELTLAGGGARQRFEEEGSLRSGGGER